ncbi:MAG: alpha/beta hydrolase [Candidatus Bathyarchaeia archaeon]
MSEENPWGDAQMGFDEKIEEIINMPVEGIEETDVTYLERPGISLLARVYRGESGKRQPVIIDVHGGAWNYNDRTIGVLYDRYIAAAGLTVFAVDFRQGPEYKHPSASEDIEAAIEYVLSNADELGGDSEHIGLIGSSAGGHLALLAGVTTEHKIDYVVALWPVSNPAYRYAYAKRRNRVTLVEAHDCYFKSEEDMKSASIPDIIEREEYKQLPPLLVVQPGEDDNIPLEMTEELIQQYKSAGGYLEYAFFPDEPHGFAHLPSPATNRCHALIVDFLKRHSKKL